MTKTEYTAAITTNQTAISALRTDLRKLHTIEKLSKSFPDLKLVDASVLESSITAKKAEVQKLRAELSKARRIVKRMSEIEDIEAGKTATAKPKKSAVKKASKVESATTAAPAPTPTPATPAAKKKASTKAPVAKGTAAKKSTATQPAPVAEVKENPAA